MHLEGEGDHGRAGAGLQPLLDLPLELRVPSGVGNEAMIQPSLRASLRSKVRSISRALLLLCAFAPVSLTAQQPAGTALTGVVFGPRGEPLYHVQVLLDAVDLVALTDSSGIFRVEGITPGPHTLTFTKPGFEARSYRFTLPNQPQPDIDLGALMLDRLRESLTTVTGTVVDSMTVEPVAAAQVGLDGEVEVISDANGVFRVDAVRAGFHTLAVRRIGYEPTFVDFEIPTGQARVNLIVKVKALPTQLAEVVVEGERTIYSSGKLREFYDRMSSGFGHFITRSAIEKSSARVPTELLYGVPGLQVIPGAFGRNTIRLARVTTGCRSPRVFVDGALIRGADIDEMLNPQDIAGIEIYTRGTEVPPTFNIQGAASCGVIVIWTM